MIKKDASVTFYLDCDKTLPGEGVYVVGNHAHLGHWNPFEAIPLKTTSTMFPQWCSNPVSIQGGSPVEYKFILQHESRTGYVMWEEFEGNRSTTFVPGSATTVKSVWGLRRSAVTTSSIGHATLKPGPLITRCSSETTLMNIAEAGAPSTLADVADAGPVAASFLSREPMRRNFSQSLLTPDVATDEDVENNSTQIFQSIEDEHDESSGEDNGNSMLPNRGVPLQHIMSFSALTDLAGPDEKAQTRAGNKAHSQYAPFNLDVPVVIVTSEVAPWSKSGGLGIVAASYAYEFTRMGHRTMVVSPKYRHYEEISQVGEAHVVVSGRTEVVRYWHHYKKHFEGAGCDYVFVDHPSIEREGGLYNGSDGREYGDNVFRFTLLCLAALEAPLILSLGGCPYGDKVAFIANDWQSGLVPIYLSYRYRRRGDYLNARTMYVIHNLGYQGQYPHIDACHFFGLEERVANHLKWGDCINLSKGAIICADRVLTVSPNYEREIKTPMGGFGLHDFTCAKGVRLVGILNGIDDSWNPESDPHIFKKYTDQDMQIGKQINKSKLQAELGLHQDGHIVLLGFIGRLTWQKGVDMLVDIIDWLMERDSNGVNGRAQLVLMGNGEEQYANTLRHAESKYKKRVCGYVGFDPKVEHKMMAGCDLLLMPSRYEPCGLPQMCAQHYGTIPVVHATGGLADSVRDISEGLDVATGFHIAPLTLEKVKEVLYTAMDMFFHDNGNFCLLQKNAILQDFYWPKAIDSYEQQIDYSLNDPPVINQS